MQLSRLDRWTARAAAAFARALARACLLAAAPEGLRMAGAAAHAKARACALLLAGLLLAAGAQAALPPNTAIANTATASFSVSGVPITVNGSATVTTSSGTPATLELLAYAPTAQGGGVVAPRNVPVSAARVGGVFVPLPAPVVPGVGTLPVPATYPLATASMYASGDPVFVQVSDPDRNLDPAVADTITVQLGSADGDTEVLRLTETGPSTGVFVGSIGTSTAAARPGDGVLNIASNERITATYIDESENHVAVTAAALVDPVGMVFDSRTGEPVTGARITIIDAATGTPAPVLGNDGVSRFPSTVVTGSTVTDAGGASYAFAPGRYQFPRLAPGSYRFRVEPPQGYTFPSVAAAGALQALPGAPFSVGTGSRGEAFALVPGPALELDVPLDPAPLGEVGILKSAGKAQAGIGEFVPYTLAITNRGARVAPGVTIADRLPPGFRYQTGSARLNDAPLADPQVAADGRSLQFALGDIAANGSVTLRYVARVGAGARPGPAENRAQSTGRVTSNVAKATVLVREDLNASRAILVGRVTVAPSCDADAAEPLKNVRVLLEDGTAIATDADGNWHADNLRPGTHVVQIDTTTLPRGVQLKNCEATDRTAGRDFSQFVNVRGGSLWRADFRLVRVPSCVDERLLRRERRFELQLAAPLANDGASATLMLPPGAKLVPGSVQLDGRPFAGLETGDGFVVLRLPAQLGHWRHALAFELEGAADAEVKALLRVQSIGRPAASLEPLVLAARGAEAQQCAPLPAGAIAPSATAAAAPAGAARIGEAPSGSADLVEKLPYDDKWLAAAAPGNEWLHPRAGFTPALPVIKVAVKHARGTQPELKVNGVAVDPLRFEGTVVSPSGDWLLSQWRSVDLREGANALELTIVDAKRQVVFHETRTIHYSVAPAKVVFDPEHSRLVADGRSSPVIAVRMLDANGQPVRRGVSGEFQLSPPYLSQQQADAIQRDPLAGNPGGRPKFTIGEDGIALIPLQPTTQSGEAVLRFEFADRPMQEVRAWLNADLRDWVLVGFAEGTLGHRQLAGNMEALQAGGAGEQLFDQNRLAFYAKGRIKGEYLLTAAYDSAKEQGTGARSALKQAIDPNRYYTLYGDASQPQYDAASSSKLYLKIEKKQFYALFGDFDTGLTVTDLGRYSRTLTGLKSEYKGERFAYNAFAARTAQSYLKDELQGDGTSGLYRLRARNLLVNSEKVRIDVRDRFQPDRILSTRSLTPYLDYQIDYVAGTLLLREPVPSRDASLNPVFIVVEYESDDPNGANWTYGGRAAMKLGQQSEVGLTHVREGNAGREGQLTAADATVQISPATRLKAEVATSSSNTGNGPRSGRAYELEVAHEDARSAARAYLAEQEPGFGLGQQLAAAQGQRKVGAEGRVKISDAIELQGDAYRQEDLVGGGSREVAEAQAQWKAGERLTVTGGGRLATERDSAGTQTQARQVTGGVAYEMPDRKLVLRASTDLDVGSEGTVNFPNRLLLGADYRITPRTTLTASQEFARGDQLRANTTRVGLRTQLWTGAEAQLGAGNQTTLDAGRLFASMGLVQRIKLGEHWSADAGIERMQTLRSTANPLGPAQPLASGTPTSASYGILTGDYTAVTTGLAYRDDVWSGNARAEWRTSDAERKVNLLLGAQRNLQGGRTVAAGLALLETTGATDTRNVNARLSYAFRPNDSDWIWLERLDYVEDANRSLAARLFTRKLISNFNANWRGRHAQAAFQYSAKYVREMLGDTSYSGYTDLLGVEGRRNIGENWDLGLSAGMLHTWASGGRSYHLGLSVGYRLATNTWVSVGYNVLGFDDADFTGAAYRAKGLYVNLRMKFDQDTFDLNDRTGGQLPLKR